MPARSRVLRLIALGCVMLVAPAIAPAQNQNQPAGSTATLTLQGVYVDADGVLRSREETAKPFRPDAKQAASQCFVSLPRLFAELQRRVEEGEPVPESMQSLNGMVRLRSIHVDVEGHDLVIVGDAEPWDGGDAGRPRGRRTGRPLLRLDDLVVAMRAVGPRARTRAFGCTLEQAPGAIERVRAVQERTAQIPTGEEDKVADAMREALGPLQAKTFGVPADSRIARVCLESDYMMKRLSLGLDQVPPSMLRSYLSRSTGTSLFNRFWFTVKYEPLRVSPDGLHIEIRGQGLQLRASNSPTDAVVNNPPAQKFADEFTTNFAKLEAAVPAFADLHNLADLAVLVALIDDDRLAERAGWDLTWALDPAGYRPAKVDVPREAAPLVNSLTKGRRTVTCSGGVEVATDTVVKSRETNAEEAVVMPAIPQGQWSVRAAAKEEPAKSRRRK